MPTKIYSADSHVTEHPETYTRHIDPAFRDRAPHVVHDDTAGDLYVIPGMERAFLPIGLIAAAGKKPEEITMGGSFADWYPGGFDPHARLADQDRDGVAGEILYPTVGMMLCNHPDPDYKKACMDAYNLWIAEYCAAHPDRLFGLGQTAMRSPAEGIEDLRKIKALGLRGVMLPGIPVQADYDSEIYDPFYEAAIDLELPLSFHILTTKSDLEPKRGPVLNHAVSILRGNQDIIGMFIFGGVFDRHPRLRIVCAEADAGWVPHHMYRMDHFYKRHRHHMHAKPLERLPSDYFRGNVYTTFQDDWVAFRVLDMVNPERFMWANDFPHSDSTWPWSQELLAEHTTNLTPRERELILHDNVAHLYDL